MISQSSLYSLMIDLTSMLSSDHRAILSLSLPIIGGMLSQNVLNLVDTAMVGQLGTTALASVGLASLLNFACSALVMGLAVGVQTQCARLRGAGEMRHAIPLNGGLALSLTLCIPLTVLLIALTPTLMGVVTDQPQITQGGSSYLAARLLGLTALGANFAFRSYWSAIERSAIYLAALLAMHICNIFFNWVFIFGHCGFEARGVEGAGIASALSMWAGVLVHFVFALRVAMPHGFLRELPSRDGWRELLRMSIPSGVERMFFAFGMATFMMMIGWIGEIELAASNILINLFLVAILPGLGFGIASATFVAKSIGAGTPERARIWRSAVSLWSLGTLSCTALVFFGWSAEIIGIFTSSPETLSYASDVLRMMAFFLPMEAFHMVMHQSMLGLGENSFVMKVTLGFQWLVTLPLVYLFGISLGWGLMWVWGVHFGIRVLCFICYSWRWERALQTLTQTERAVGSAP